MTQSLLTSSFLGLSVAWRAKLLFKDVWITVACYRWLIASRKQHSLKIGSLQVCYFVCLFEKYSLETDPNELKSLYFSRLFLTHRAQSSVTQSVLPEAVGSSATPLSSWAYSNAFRKSDYPLGGCKNSFRHCSSEVFSAKGRMVWEVALNT